jgi:hypothetical protein
MSLLAKAVLKLGLPAMTLGAPSLPTGLHSILQQKTHQAEQVVNPLRKAGLTGLDVVQDHVDLLRVQDGNQPSLLPQMPPDSKLGRAVDAEKRSAKNPLGGLAVLGLSMFIGWRILARTRRMANERADLFHDAFARDIRQRKSPDVIAQRFIERAMFFFANGKHEQSFVDFFRAGDMMQLLGEINGDPIEEYSSIIRNINFTKNLSNGKITRELRLTTRASNLIYFLNHLAGQTEGRNANEAFWELYYDLERRFEGIIQDAPELLTRFHVTNYLRLPSSTQWGENMNAMIEQRPDLFNLADVRYLVEADKIRDVNIPALTEAVQVEGDGIAG